MRMEGGRLAVWLGPRHQSLLEHWHHTFVASWSNAAYGRQLVTSR
jgi:hypothetical protein